MERIVYCKRCGRRLRGQVSRALGYGPCCAKKINVNQHPLFDIDHFSVEEQPLRQAEDSSKK